jgi:nitrite reductase/ring-hydroxylating ferredoxin subunit
MKNSAADRVAQFVEDLLKGRRPRRFEATQEEAEAMSAAAGLAAAHVGADLPDKAALDRIHRRLAERLDDSPAVEGRYSRRVWLRTFGTAAAAAVLGVAIDEVVTRTGSGAPVVATDGVLTPDGGQWRPVAAVEKLPAGQAMTVATESVDAIIVNDGGQISAVSGICTHLGCKLQPDNADQRLSCPCHQTAFGFSGKVLYYRLKAAPPDLPRIQSRVKDGQIELFV